MLKFVRPSIFAVVLLVVISGTALFIHPLIGLADNGDFERVMVSNDLGHEADRDPNDYFGYFNHEYDKLQYYNEYYGIIKSTQNIVIKLAVFLDDLLTRDEKFDVRFIAIFSLAVLSFAIYWLVEIVGKMVSSKVAQYFLALVAVVVFGDIGYTSYFNSFFGEAVSYPFFLLSIVAMLKFSIDPGIRKRYLFVYFFATIMFVGSKNQLALNGILAFLLLFILLFIKIPNRKKVLSATFAFLLLGFSFVMYFVIDDTIYLINKYHMMTRGVMLFEPDVQEVTEEVGLDERFALLAGTIYYDSTPVIDPEDELLKDNFYSQYDLFSVAFYYLKNPNAFSKIMDFGWKNSFTIRPEVLGNYEREYGREYGEKTKFFSFWSYVKENHIPHSSNFAYFFLVICLALAINRFIQYKNKGSTQITYYSEIIMLYVFLTGFSQLLASFIGAGDADLKKHLFMTTVCLDILFYYYFAYVVSVFWKGKKIKE